MRIKIIKYNANANITYPAYKSDAGYDVMPTGYELSKNQIKFYTGIAIQMPKPNILLRLMGFSYVCKAHMRSSVKHYDMILTNAVGLIDFSYRGEITAVFRTFGDNQMIANKIMEEKKAIIQLTFELVQNNLKLQFVKKINETKRGDKGYGSSNKKYNT